jgi:D-alanine-D-alanine ligase
VTIRTDLRPEDRAPLEALLRATGFFNARELHVALELVDDKLARAEKSDYRFLILEDGGSLQGYACWGPITVTVASADLYWMAVHPDLQGKGLGRTLLEAVETWMAREGCTRVYLETSTRAQYAPTRAFYLRCGYTVVAELPDFYTPGDGKAIFLKILPRIH